MAIRTIAGTGFQAGCIASFGGVNGTSNTFVSSTSMTTVPPAHAAGAVDVRVTNLDGSYGVLAGGYTYTAGAAPPAGYALWLDPNTLSDGAVATWSDSGHGWVQATGANQPTKSSAPAVVTFDGTDYLTNSDLIASGTMTVGLKFKFDVIPTSTADFQHIFSFKTNAAPFWFELLSVPDGAWGNFVFSGLLGGSNTGIRCNPTLDTSYHRMVITYDGVDNLAPSSYTCLLDGTLQTLSTTSSNPLVNANGALGALGSGLYGFKGKQKGVVVYDSVLSAGNITALDTFLASL